MEHDATFQKAVATSHGRRPPPTAARFGPTTAQRGGRAGVPPSSMGARGIGTAARPITGALQDGQARPMTAVRAAGFTAAGIRGTSHDISPSFRLIHFLCIQLVFFTV